jgi:hypothetical protein
MGTASRNFVSKKAAEKWARETEQAIEKGMFESKPKGQKEPVSAPLVPW